MSNTVNSVGNMISFRNHIHGIFTTSNNHLLIDKDLDSNYRVTHLRGALFTDGTSVPLEGEIRLSSIMGKHFAQLFLTGDYHAYSDYSASSTYLQGTTAFTSNSGTNNTANRRITLLTGQNTSYSIILLSPHGRDNTENPGIVVNRGDSNVVDEATVWLKVVNHNTYRLMQFGIIKKDNALTWAQQKAYLTNKHATFADRMGFHGWGYHNYTGARDDLTSTSTVAEPNYKTGTYNTTISSNFHNIIGKTAGTMRSQANTSSNAGGTDFWFFKNSFQNYSSYRADNITSSIGLKIKWYTTTLPVTFTKGSSEITPQSGTWSVEALSTVFSGMYLSGTTKVSLDSDGKGVFIGKVYTDSLTMYREKDVSTLTEITASSSGNDTITLSGYLYWTLAADTNDQNPVILGPPHAVLPRFHADSPGGSTSDITEWAFYIGDTTSSTTNTFNYDIMDTDPLNSDNTAFSYSVTYGLKPDPPAAYEYAFNNYSTLADPLSGTLTSVTPSLSGINIRDPPGWTNISWYNYSMGHRYKFLVSGQIIAIGSMNRYGSELKLFREGNSTAVASASAWSSWSYDATNRYRYVTLSSPVSVSANQSYWVMIKNYSGGYSGHPYTVTPYPSPPKTTTSGNIQFTASGYRYTGRGTNSSSSQSSLTRYPSAILSSTNYLYGNTDLIFLPD